MGGLDLLLAPGGANALILVSFRVTGLVLLAPTFSSRQIPMRYRVMLLLLLSALLWPVAWHRAAGTPIAALDITPSNALTETVIGMVIGLGVLVTVAGSELAGDLIAMQTGLGGASTLDPVTYQSTPTVGTFFRLVTITLLLSLDMHLVLIDALAATFRVIPLGATVNVANGMKAMAMSAGTLFTIGLRMAAPTMVAILTLNVALGVLSRAAPQLQILQLMTPMQIMLGLFVLAGSLPLMAAVMTGWQGGFDSLVGHLLDAFQPTSVAVR
jgi:flagellar biosynthetic protein FliR